MRSEIESDLYRWLEASEDRIGKLRRKICQASVEINGLPRIVSYLGEQPAQLTIDYVVRLA
ncbi:MAG: hypothetical protein AB7I19_12395 [Planctomycetota bacterium]